MRTILRTKIIVLLLVLVSAVNLHAQWINSITHFPSNPTSADTIYFYADVSFPSGSCNDHTQYGGVTSPYVYANALHCIGSLTFICSYTDTFKINPLAAGNYTFIFHVDYGALPSPCTPGIVPGPTDSLQFTVSPGTYVSFANNENRDVLLFPNPAADVLTLQMSNERANSKNKSFVIYSMEGTEIGRWKLSEWTPSEEAGISMREFNISNLSNGIYFCKLITENSVNDKIKLIVMK